MDKDDKNENFINNDSNRLIDILSDTIKITDLIEIDKLQELQDSFAFATNVASIITDTNGVPITKPSNFCRLCNDIIRKTDLGCRNCMYSDAILGRTNPAGPIMQPCLSGGLWDGGASICVGNRHIANWLIGQIRNSDTPVEKILEYADVIGADRKQFKEALAEVNIMSTEQFSRVCHALFLIANQISDLAYKNLELRRKESDLQTTLDSIGDAVISTNDQGEIVRMNPVAESITGWKFSDAKGKMLSEVFRLLSPESRKTNDSPAGKVKASENGLSFSGSSILLDKNGFEKPIANSIAPIHSSDNIISGTVIVFRDISSQIIMEEQLRQSYKMDAIGQLAGGVAHDFNNMLTGIIGAADVISMRTENIPDVKRMLNVIHEATEKASGLVRKLLDFSRKGKKASSPMDLHVLVENVINILERTVDKKIKIESDLQADEFVIIGDVNQLQSAILNIGINSRDAMQYGGKLIFSTRNIDFTEKESELLSGDIQPGYFIELSISDTGVGIPVEIQKNIFEPFFTTKEIGKGTGLGLSAVYGAVKDHTGSIHVYSEPDIGTVFKIYLPVSMGAICEKTVEDLHHGICCIGTILLVDDEVFIRETATILLEGMGNRVLTAEDGLEALKILESNPSGVDLIILDMIMPKMNGRETFESIRKISESIPVIFSSGFIYNQSLDELLKKENVVDFLPKPFRLIDLYNSLDKAMKYKDKKSQVVIDEN